MEILIYTLLAMCAVIILLLIVIIAKKPQKDNALALLDQKMDMQSKQTVNAMEHLSLQMKGLTDKNYEKQIKLLETLNSNAEKQTKVIGEAIGSMQKSN